MTVDKCLAFGLTLIATCLTSCVSVTSVTKVTPGRNVKGFRYALPQPYILAVPKADGSVTYTEMSLPDISQEYAISNFTFGARNTLAIDADHLLLKKLAVTKDTTALAKQVLSSGGNIAKTEIEEQAKRRDTATAAETKAREAIMAKELALSLAKAERAALSPDASKEVIAAADLMVAKAEIELNATRRQYASVLGANVARSNPGVPGPVLFKVVDHGDKGVELIAVKINGNAQQSFLTSTKKKPAVSVPALRVLVTSDTTLSRGKLAGSMEIIFGIDSDVDDFKVTSVKNLTLNAAISAENLIVNRVGPKSFRLTIVPLPPIGTYSIEYGVTRPEGTASQTGSVKVVLLE